MGNATHFWVLVSSVAIAGGCVAQSPPPTPAALRDKIPAPWVYPGATVPCPRLTQWVRGGPLPRFAPEKVYAFDFFSTTCDHCEEVGPLVAEMARVFRPNGVEFIGVSSESAEVLNAWLAKPPQHDDITYSIASDPTHAADAALQDGTLQRSTPHIYIVRDNIVLWYGHPNLAQEVLVKVIAGTWDPSSVKDQVVRESRRNWATATATELARKCEKSGDFAPLIALFDAIDQELPADRDHFDALRFTILLGDVAQASRAYAFGRQVAARPTSDAAILRAFARTTVSAPHAAVRDLDFALEMAQRAEKLGGGKDPKSAVALAMVQFARGNREEAIKQQERAISLEKDEVVLTKMRADLVKYQTQPPGPLPVRAHGKPARNSGS